MTVLLYSEQSAGVSFPPASLILLPQLLTTHPQAPAANGTRWQCLFLVGSFNFPCTFMLTEKKAKVELLNSDIDIPMQ